MKAFNVIIIILATCLTWFTEAKIEDKLFLTVFFTIALIFWMMTMIDDNNKKIVL